MSVGLDMSRVRVVLPRLNPFRYLAVTGKVPRYRDFVMGLDAETNRRIEAAGYNVVGIVRLGAG